MTDPANGASIDGIHNDDVAAAMAQQLSDLLDNWLDQVTEITKAGIDPTPLLQALAGFMRSAADQLDPPA